MTMMMMMMTMTMTMMIMTIVSVEQRPGWGEHVLTDLPQELLEYHDGFMLMTSHTSRGKSGTGATKMGIKIRK